MPDVLRAKNLSPESVRAWRSARPAVAVAIVMHEAVPRTAAAHFLRLAKGLRDDDQLIFSARSAQVAITRNHLIELFLATECQYLVMIDDDMTVDVDWIERLTWWEQPFVSAFCTRRVFPYLPTASLRGAVNVFGAQEYHAVSNWYPGTGLRECDGVGAGVICLRRDLLEQIPPPYFEFTHAGGGEDYRFCEKVTELGHRIWVDTALLAGHIGESVITINTWLSDGKPWVDAQEDSQDQLTAVTRVVQHQLLRA